MVGNLRLASMTFTAKDFAELKDIADNKPGFIKAMWCGELACEEALKEKAGVTSRCMPFAQEEIAKVDVSEQLVDYALKTYVDGHSGYTYEVPVTWNDMITVGRKINADRAAQG